MTELLRKRYIDFINLLDPYNQENAPDSLSDMLYNLLAIKDESDAWKNDCIELYEMLMATIDQFKAAGIEII